MGKVGDFFSFLNPLRSVPGVLERLVGVWERLVNVQINKRREYQKIDEEKKDNELERAHREKKYLIEEKEAELELMKKKMHLKIDMLERMEKTPLVQMNGQRRAHLTNGLIHEILELPDEEEPKLLPP